MKVVLADGRTIGFSTNIELAKFLLFGAEKLKTPITYSDNIVMTDTVAKLMTIKKLIQQRNAFIAMMALSTEVIPLEEEDKAPF